MKTVASTQSKSSSFLVLVALSLSSYNVVAAELSITPSMIRPGEKADLVWKAEQSQVFLSGFGIVSSAGQIVVAPAESMTYWLVTNDGKNTIVFRKDITVKGTRGLNDVTIDYSMFPLARRFVLSSNGYERFLESVEQVLSGVWGAMPIWLRAPTDHNFTAITQSVQSERLYGLEVGSTEAWKVAFLIKIEDPVIAAGLVKINFQVSAALLSRKRNEKNFSSIGSASGGVEKKVVEMLISDIERVVGNNQ